MKSRAKGAKLSPAFGQRSKAGTNQQYCGWQENSAGWTMNKKVIELIRVSTEGQAAEGRAGVPAQRAANRRTAQQYGLEIVRTIEMADVSGAAVLMAPEMKELLRLMESPQIHGVVAKEFSRLMRPENFTDYALLQAFVDTRTVLYLPDGLIDMSSKAGRLMGPIRAAIAGLERTEILERVWAAKEENRRAGKHPQSWITLPFGVAYDEHRGWYYKAEAEKVREAVRLFLGGETSYRAVGEKLGIDPFNLRVILRNPIYAGWRVYSQRRDPSPAAKRTKQDGRQADRPKVARTPEEVIRVKVMDGILSEDEFSHLQRLLDLKRERHWRSRLDYEHRFVYNGFLNCSACNEIIYTHHRGRDYYICKNRRLSGKCESRYMRRERLEASLDSLFAQRLTDGDFLEDLMEQYRHGRDGENNQVVRLQSELRALAGKRERVLGTYFDGVITQEERDRRLAAVERDQALYRQMLMRESPEMSFSAAELAQVFAPFHEWEFLSRDHKRRLLQAIVPGIHAHNYRVAGLSILTDRCRNEISPTGKGSWRRRA